MYQLTKDPDVIRCVETGTFIQRDHWMWPTEWLENNIPLPVEEPKATAQIRADLVAAATEQRWQHETGGILINGVRVGTGLDDQNRLSGVLSAIQLGGLDSVDFKAQNGWVELTAGELQAIALAISAHVQACFTAERVHHQAIEQLADADLATYDVTQGWP